MTIEQIINAVAELGTRAQNIVNALDLRSIAAEPNPVRAAALYRVRQVLQDYVHQSTSARAKLREARVTRIEALVTRAA